MNPIKIVTTSRREFINLPHMLSHAIGLTLDDKLVINIIGGRDIKKSLAVDAFVLAMAHERGVFHVPASDRMMFEDAPSQADTGIAEGTISCNGNKVSIGFTRNLWEQESFHRDVCAPSVLIIPKKNPFSVMTSCVADVIIHLHDTSDKKRNFNHLWEIEIVSKTLQSRPNVQAFMARMNGVSKKQESRQFPAWKR